MKLIYSDFVANRPEPIQYLELWCLLGGTVIFIYIVADSGIGFSGRPRFETILSIAFPAGFFYINYLARYISWMNKVLIVHIIGGLVFSGYLFLFPKTVHHLPNSDIALVIFCAVSLLLVMTRSMRK